MGIFGISFIIYGILPIFATWDFRTQGQRMYIERIFSGIYQDFNAEWFEDVGHIICSTMMFNVWMPPIEFAIFWLLRYAFRAWDQRSLIVDDLKRSHSLSIEQFVGLYSGAVFYIHYKYAFILTVVFVTFTFGAGMPVLFPIALFSLLSLYVTERLAMAYAYRQPPNYDMEAH